MNPGPAALARARHLLELRRYEQALAELAPAAAAPVTEADAHCLRAQALLGLRRHPEAERAARQALTLRPDGEWPHRLLAIALLNRRRVRAASRAAAEATRLAPSSAHALHVRAVTEVARRRRAAAGATAAASLAANPHSPLAHRTAALAAEARHRWADAEASYRAGLALDPNDRELTLGLAELLHRRGRRDEAAAAYLAAARIDPTARSARRGLSRLGLPLVGFGLLGKLVGFQVIRLVLVNAHGPDVAAVVFGSLLLLGCLLTTALRLRALRAVPAPVRQGLRADIRNAALGWLAVAGALSLAVGGWAAALAGDRGGGPVRAVGYAVLGVGMLAAAYRWRVGPPLDLPALARRCRDRTRLSLPFRR